MDRLIERSIDRLMDRLRSTRDGLNNHHRRAPLRHPSGTQNDTAWRARKGQFFICFSILFAVRAFSAGTKRPHPLQSRRLKQAQGMQSTGRCESRDKRSVKKCVIFYFPSFSYRKMSVLVFISHFKRAPKRHPKSTPKPPQKYP